ncbi:hypothetical protein AB0H42_27595, partial [Nocardia sp. NPDC050799]|uniref:hypothetical protein n=1 Tax=Nocardia sp. NPDC050799 TaxID=3154842 RepID=UPI0033FE966B
STNYRRPRHITNFSTRTTGSIPHHRAYETRPNLRGVQPLVPRVHLLPAIIARIHAGENVDIDSGLPGLDFGDDEIGQVANAFETAQRTAVAAAVTEPRPGMRSTRYSSTSLTAVS